MTTAPERFAGADLDSLTPSNPKGVTMVEYLETTIAEARRTDAPRYGMTADGYTKRSGAPTSLMIRLDGEKRWRRLMCWQFSNAGTVFVRVAGRPLVVREYDIPAVA